MKRLNLQPITYNVPDMASIPPNPYEEEEGQGYAWRKRIPGFDASAAVREAQGRAGSEAIKAAAEAIIKASGRSLPAVDLEPIRVVSGDALPRNWRLLSPKGLDQPKQPPPPEEWCPAQFLPAFERRPQRGVEEPEADDDAEQIEEDNAKRLEEEISRAAEAAGTLVSMKAPVAGGSCKEGSKGKVRQLGSGHGSPSLSAQLSHQEGGQQQVDKQIQKSSCRGHSKVAVEHICQSRRMRRGVCLLSSCPNTARGRAGLTSRG